MQSWDLLRSTEPSALTDRPASIRVGAIQFRAKITMTYAPASIPIYDADSHIMELPDFLRDFADPSIRDELHPKLAIVRRLSVMRKSPSSLSKEADTARRTSASKSHSETNSLPNPKKFRPWVHLLEPTGPRRSICSALRGNWSLRRTASRFLFTPVPRSQCCAMEPREPTIGTWLTFAKRTTAFWAWASFHWMILQEPSVSSKQPSI